MERHFNIAGPCTPTRHYMLPPERRLGGVMELFRNQSWFGLVAGRQTGKTTSAQWLTRHLTASGAYNAVWIDLETVRRQPDVGVAMRAIFDAFVRCMAYAPSPVALPSSEAQQQWLANPSGALIHLIRALCEASDRPLVLFLDEADVLVGEAMVSFLTQLRELYIGRSAGAPAPSSVVLVGVRNVRDYVLDDSMRSSMRWLGSASPFNVTVENVTLGPFTRDEVAELLAQHTAATGQVFAPDAVERVWWLSQGHPVAGQRPGRSGHPPRRQGPHRPYHRRPRRQREGNHHPRTPHAHRLAPRAASGRPRAARDRAHACRRAPALRGSR